MTANAFQEDRQLCLEAGMNDFVPKPVSPRDLFETLLRWLPNKTEAERIAQEMLKRPFLKPSETYWLLSTLDGEGLLYLMAIARKRSIQQAVSLYVTTLRKVAPLVGGEDLKSMGYIPGPQYRTILNHLIEMQLDGEVATRDQALAFIRSAHPIQPRQP